ncbi:hypothetical protein CYMTET_33594 [Cymbomonas tetramitiformis]|uniref:EF-hand domain-containing protein n=1 Tax=Cymbomonas tetramitiformis TaxID=36881 RepID=A0AAE0KR12_9CHLO|nr:hypothetical protein CYMTET_33594 [Cymbomonas tetramitiformis]
MDERATDEAIVIYLQCDLVQEYFIVPKPMTVATKELSRLYEIFDVCSKTYITVDDLMRECRDEPFVRRLMAQNDINFDGKLTRDEFDLLVIKVCQEKPNLDVRERIYLTFSDPTSSKMSHCISLFIMVLIVLSSISFVTETMQEFASSPSDDMNGEPIPDPIFGHIEAFCIICFTVEFLSRAFTVHAIREQHELTYVLFQPSQKTDHHPPTRSGLQKTVSWVLDVMNVIDLAAILPFYIELSLGAGSGGFGFLRVVRLARIFRVFKMGKYNEGMKMFAGVMIESLQAMTLLFFFLAISLVVFGSMIYFAEAGTWTVSAEYPDGVYLRPDITHTSDEISPFKSIPDSFWWVMVTVSSVGYGDYYPTTVFGKVIAVACMTTGVLVLALPVTIIGANFANEYCDEEAQLKRKREKLATRERYALAWKEQRYEELLRDGAITEKDISESHIEQIERHMLTKTEPKVITEEERLAAAAVVDDAIADGKGLLQQISDSSSLPEALREDLSDQVQLLLRMLEAEGGPHWKGPAESLIVGAATQFLRRLSSLEATEADKKLLRLGFMILLTKVRHCTVSAEAARTFFT